MPLFYLYLELNFREYNMLNLLELTHFRLNLKRVQSQLVDGRLYKRKPNTKLYCFSFALSRLLIVASFQTMLARIYVPHNLENHVL